MPYGTNHILAITVYNGVQLFTTVYNAMIELHVPIIAHDGMMEGCCHDPVSVINCNVKVTTPEQKLRNTDVVEENIHVHNPARRKRNHATTVTYPKRSQYRASSESSVDDYCYGVQGTKARSPPTNVKISYIDCKVMIDIGA